MASEMAAILKAEEVEPVEWATAWRRWHEMLNRDGERG